MSQEISITKHGKHCLLDSLGSILHECQPTVVGIASAFVSTGGIQKLHGMLAEQGLHQCRIIAGLDGTITHPEALYAAHGYGWKLRLASSKKGIFHPKLIVAGRRFRVDGLLSDTTTVYVGSANLTNGGLFVNTECGLIASSGDCLASASRAFASLWNEARPATQKELKNYAARFAEMARTRTPEHLEDIGIADSATSTITTKQLIVSGEPSPPALKPSFATAAWAGLQSFTGGYRFQVEFPRAAGEVLGGILRRQTDANGYVDVYCPDDGETRSMSFRYYADNSMFRLNIPNDTPGVSWARENHDGVALIEAGPAGGARLRLRILRPGYELQGLLRKSVALGTWGRTKTRLYGWS